MPAGVNALRLRVIWVKQADDDCICTPASPSVWPDSLWRGCRWAGLEAIKVALTHKRLCIVFAAGSLCVSAGSGVSCWFLSAASRFRGSAAFHTVF